MFIYSIYSYNHSLFSHTTLYINKGYLITFNGMISNAHTNVKFTKWNKSMYLIPSDLKFVDSLPLLCHNIYGLACKLLNGNTKIQCNILMFEEEEQN